MNIDRYNFYRENAIGNLAAVVYTISNSILVSKNANPSHH